MKRRTAYLIVGCVCLTLIYLAIQPSLSRRFFARGRILLTVNFADSTSASAVSNWHEWHYSQLAVANDLLEDSEKFAALVRDSSATGHSIKFESIVPYRGVRILGVDFSGPEKDSVWRVASNAARMVTAIYATNQPFEFQATNQITFKVEHLDTGFWKPKPHWERLWDGVDELYRHVF